MGYYSARKASGLLQIEVAKEMGVSDAAVSLWESGKTNPRVSMLIPLARLYHCTVDELLSSDETTN